MSGVQTEQDHLRLAAYYGVGNGTEQAIAAGLGCVPRVRADIHPDLAQALGLKPGGTLTEPEVAHLLAGRRADGAEVPTGHVHPMTSGKEGEAKHKIAAVDFTLSMPKGASVWAMLAPTMAERHSILQCHHDALDEVMAYAERQLGWVTKGKERIPERAVFAWFGVTHHTSRPTVELMNGQGDTELHEVPLPGMPNVHTHILALNKVLSESGRLVAMNRDLLQDRVKEIGAVYQAIVARNLRRIGIEVGLDESKNLAYLPGVPEVVCKAFSPRTDDGMLAARDFAKRQGLDWGTMSPEQRIALVHTATQASKLAKSTVAPADGGLSVWQARAAKLGWKPPALKPQPAVSRSESMGEARRVAQAVLSDSFDERAVLPGTEARWAAAVGLIATTIESTDDVSVITKDMREHGIKRQDEQVSLIPRSVGDRHWQMTTSLHVANEERFVALAKAAHEDRSAALPEGTLRGFLAAFATERGISTTGAHWKAQEAAALALGTGGKLAVALGVAGAGKTTVLTPVVRALQAEGKEVWGVATAWEHARRLCDTGVEKERHSAIDPFLRNVAMGKIVLHKDSVILIEEISKVSPEQGLKLLELQEEFGLSIKAIGDDGQGRAIGAGDLFDLLRRAMGEKTIPFIETTMRQKTAQEIEVAEHFRHGRAAEALAIMRDNGRAVMVPGGYQEAVQATAEKWLERSRILGPNKVSVSAPTNAASHDIGVAIRAIKVAQGVVKEWGQRRIVAADQNGEERTLHLGRGDEVRLFDRTRATFIQPDGRKQSAFIGNNGSILTIHRARPDGLELRAESGKVGFVPWDGFKKWDGEQRVGPVRLAYGYVTTIDVAQGETRPSHIGAFGSGSALVTRSKAYVAGSRHEHEYHAIFSEGVELRAAIERRPVGVEGEVTKAELWASVAKNLSRADLKEGALAFLERAARQAQESVQAFQATARVREALAPVGNAVRQQVAARVVAGQIMRTVTGMEAAMNQGPAPRFASQVVERQVSQPAPRQPARATRRYEVSEAEVLVQFTDAAHRFGLRPKGGILLDGQHHYAPLEGQKGKQSGAYRAFMEGIRPTIVLYNYRTGDKQTFSANGEMKTMSPEEAEAIRAAAAEKARQDAAEKVRKQANAAQKAAAMWSAGKPADPAHPYLVKKGVQPHGLRQDDEGRLLVPLRDVQGKLWNMQTIEPDGTKLNLSGGRKVGTHAMLGVPRRMGDPYIIAEGFATAATLRELTGCTTIVALDANNLLPVAEALRAKEPGHPIYIAGDNDWKLPLRPTPLQNVGEAKARAAAEAVGGRALIPQFDGRDGTDWNDAVKLFGAEETKLALRAAWREAPAQVQPQTAKPTARVRMA